MLKHLTKPPETPENVDWTADWTCKKCKASVFAKKRECYKCHAPRVPLSALKRRFAPAKAQPAPASAATTVPGQGGGSSGEATLAGGAGDSGVQQGQVSKRAVADDAEEAQQVAEAHAASVSSPPCDAAGTGSSGDTTLDAKPQHAAHARPEGVCGGGDDREVEMETAGEEGGSDGGEEGGEGRGGSKVQALAPDQVLSLRRHGDPDQVVPYVRICWMWAPREWYFCTVKSQSPTKGWWNVQFDDKAKFELQLSASNSANWFVLKDEADERHVTSLLLRMQKEEEEAGGKAGGRCAPPAETLADQACDRDSERGLGVGDRKGKERDNGEGESGEARDGGEGAHHQRDGEEGTVAVGARERQEGTSEAKKRKVESESSDASSSENSNSDDQSPLKKAPAKEREEGKRQHGEDRKMEGEAKPDGPVKRGVEVRKDVDRAHKRQKDGAETASASYRPPLLIPRNVARTDSSADTLLKNVIEQRFNKHFRYGGGCDSEWKFFEFRSSKNASAADSRAYYDDEGMVYDPKFDETFIGVNPWAQKILKRQVSVKPVIYYNGKSIREYEQIALQEAQKEKMKQCAGVWTGPSDPDSVWSWVQFQLKGVEKRLNVGTVKSVSVDEVHRIVRQVC